MIFYFSGTGNSRWVAKQLARLLDDQTCDTTALTEMPDIKKEKQIGFVFPVYAWGAPEPMEAFAMKLPKIGVFFFWSLYLWRRSWHGNEAVFQALSAGQQLQFSDAKQLHCRYRYR